LRLRAKLLGNRKALVGFFGVEPRVADIARNIVLQILQAFAFRFGIQVSAFCARVEQKSIEDRNEDSYADVNGSEG
jgi:hypothetical protein